MRPFILMAVYRHCCTRSLAKVKPMYALFFKVLRLHSQVQSLSSTSDDPQASMSCKVSSTGDGRMKKICENRGALRPQMHGALFGLTPFTR